MRSRYGTNVAFLDMTLNTLLAISALFVIAFLLIKEEDKKITDLPEPPVQIMVTLEWPIEGAASKVDMDLWIQEGTADENAVGFRSPVREGIALERDDLGNRGGDVYNTIVKGKTVQDTIPINREVINFRRLPEDEITVNAMYYFSQKKDVAVPCKVQVYKLNPFQVIYEGEYTLKSRGDEYTFVRFKMTEDGKVKDLHHRQKSIVYARPATPVYSSDRNEVTNPFSAF